MKKYKINTIKWNLEKYNSSPLIYDKFQILLLMENASVHLVSVFKDYLLYDDTTEFFKEYYTKNEIYKKLIAILDYYESSSYLFPNYTALNEGKYIYRNIIKKQKLIDYLEDLEDKMKEKEEKIKHKKNNLDEGEESSSSNYKVFDTSVYNSIIKETGNDSKMNEIFCVGHKQNNNCSDSIGSLLKLIEEIKGNKNKNIEKEKENKTDKEINKNKTDNKDNNKECNINNKNNNNNNIICYKNINLNDVNKKIKNKIISKLYISKKLNINHNLYNSRKLFKRSNININNLLKYNLSTFTPKNINVNDMYKNQIINTDNYKSNQNKYK